jgi:cytochrome b561
MTTFSPASGPVRYASASRLLHWLTVILVLTTIPAGLVMVEQGLPRWLQDSLFLYHKNIGPVILLLVILRLVFRFVHRPPPFPDTLPRSQALVAETVHWLLYACLIVMAVSGTIRVQAGGFPMEIWDPLFGGMVSKDKALADTAKAVHYWVRIPLILLILAHIGAAAMHGLIKKDGIFSRMWPPV